jgi:hypothetical protein
MLARVFLERGVTPAQRPGGGKTKQGKSGSHQKLK